MGYGSSTTHGSTNAGPHKSNVLNSLDPRVDSDRDGSRNMGAAQYGPGAHTSGSGIGSTHTTHGSSNAGPHSSSAFNSADPRVDSDMDGSRNMGAAQYGAGAHTSGTHTSGTGIGSSNLLNKLDP